MWLLQCEDGGQLTHTQHVSNAPRYAILSHMWGADREEVTFQDVRHGTGQDKLGYQKIRFCGQQASKDSLDSFWVDTCCIDKSSSAELSEAINSMFRWYQEADKCYVYLSDISIKNNQSLKESRWFTRGWTLQELVAPTSVEFFSAEFEWLGDKSTLLQEIYDSTGIPSGVLQGTTPLSQISVRDRLSWVKSRATKRPEDRAYSLLGIFDVHMPLLYGEGENKAFIRLKEVIHKSSLGPMASDSLTNNQSGRLRCKHRAKTNRLRIRGRSGDITVRGRVVNANTGIKIKNDTSDSYSSASIRGGTGSIEVSNDSEELNSGIYAF
ncbi:HET-domain-containing protein [Plenodomus tracheiphilus IPT5]|uniref:HET-domain-containing protein n=1 Tax=Plenodomus tracheiphilus IPT5 TaxID=1408161 RepID=A0A6A7BBZ4_9PLEO|nr:HET-domain-containing protein [Plenodomus tracheiphilus IPT5]